MRINLEGDETKPGCLRIDHELQSTHVSLHIGDNSSQALQKPSNGIVGTSSEASDSVAEDADQEGQFAELKHELKVPWSLAFDASHEEGYRASWSSTRLRSLQVAVAPFALVMVLRVVIALIARDYYVIWGDSGDISSVSQPLGLIILMVTCVAVHFLKKDANYNAIVFWIVSLSILAGALLSATFQWAHGIPDNVSQFERGIKCGLLLCFVD